MGVGNLTLNKAESVTLKGRTFMPEDGFIGLLTEIQDDFEHYLVTEGFWTRLGNFVRGKIKPGSRIYWQWLIVKSKLLCLSMP